MKPVLGNACVSFTLTNYNANITDYICAIFSSLGNPENKTQWR